jgi:hypothetical protein
MKYSIGLVDPLSFNIIRADRKKCNAAAYKY